LSHLVRLTDLSFHLNLYKRNYSTRRPSRP
jgi:hypothetical protein